MKEPIDDKTKKENWDKFFNAFFEEEKLCLPPELKKEVAEEANNFARRLEEGDFDGVYRPLKW